MKKKIKGVQRINGVCHQCHYINRHKMCNTLSLLVDFIELMISFIFSYFFACALFKYEYLEIDGSMSPIKEYRTVIIAILPISH